MWAHVFVRQSLFVRQIIFVICSIHYCFYYFRSLNKDQVRCACSYKPKSSNVYTKPDWLLEHNAGKGYTPSYNLAPTEVTPVLISASKYKNESYCDRIIKPMMWGMIPPWHKVLTNLSLVSFFFCPFFNKHFNNIQLCYIIVSVLVNSVKSKFAAFYSLSIIIL